MQNIAIMGHGVVGGGVVDVLNLNRNVISSKIGDEVHVKRVLDLCDFKNLSYSDIFTKNFSDILEDDDITIVVETIGGLTPSYEYTKALLNRKKNVVTSNKELVSQRGNELLEIAKNNGVYYLFEASVGGGIPIISPLQNSLQANKVQNVYGILNGTTNFIITSMLNEGISFDVALDLAKRNGYAEKDPTADISGADVARKMSILACLAYGVYVNPDEIYKEGIGDISLVDLQYARKCGYSIKFLGSAELLESGELSIIVCPTLVSNSDQLAHVDGVFNAIAVEGNVVGKVMFFGAGAGKMATASAVVSDILSILCSGHVNNRFKFYSDNSVKVQLHDYGNRRFYFRVRFENLKYAKKIISSEFPEVEFCCEIGSKYCDLVLITYKILERNVNNFVLGLESKGFKVLSRFRVFN